MEKIGSFAKRNQVSTRTLHYYDEIGLLVPERVNGVRMYSKEDDIALKRILVLRDLGFSLNEVASFLNNFVPLTRVSDLQSDFIKQRDEINSIIAKLDSFRLDQTIRPDDNPIALSIRNIMGDRYINDVYDTHTIDPSVYAKRLDSLIQGLKENCDDDDLLLLSVERYYQYFTEDLHLDIGRAEFERIISDNIESFSGFETKEKKRILDSIRKFVLFE